MDNIGKILRINGTIVDAQFDPEQVPKISNLLYMLSCRMTNDQHLKWSSVN